MYLGKGITQGYFRGSLLRARGTLAEASGPGFNPFRGGIPAYKERFVKSSRLPLRPRLCSGLLTNTFVPP